MDSFVEIIISAERVELSLLRDLFLQQDSEVLWNEGIISEVPVSLSFLPASRGDSLSLVVRNTHGLDIEDLKLQETLAKPLREFSRSHQGVVSFFGRSCLYEFEAGQLVTSLDLYSKSETSLVRGEPFALHGETREELQGELSALLHECRSSMGPLVLGEKPAFFLHEDCMVLSSYHFPELFRVFATIRESFADMPLPTFGKFLYRAGLRDFSEISSHYRFSCSRVLRRAAVYRDVALLETSRWPSGLGGEHVTRELRVFCREVLAAPRKIALGGLLTVETSREAVGSFSESATNRNPLELKLYSKPSFRIK